MLLLNCAICGKRKLTFIKNQELSNDQFRMNKIINKFLLTREKFIPELHLKQLGFIYSARGSFTNQRQRIQKFRETGNLKHLYRDKLVQVCFAHHATQSDSKDLGKRNILDKILKDRDYEIARNRSYDGY